MAKTGDCGTLQDLDKRVPGDPELAAHPALATILKLDHTPNLCRLLHLSKHPCLPSLPLTHTGKSPVPDVTQNSPGLQGRDILRLTVATAHALRFSTGIHTRAGFVAITSSFPAVTREHTFLGRVILDQDFFGEPYPVSAEPQGWPFERSVLDPGRGISIYCVLALPRLSNTHRPWGGGSGARPVV